MFPTPCTSVWSSLGNAFVTATELFIEQHAGDDITRLALQRNRYPGVDIDFALRQIEGRQRTKDKLSAISHIAGWHYPQRLGLEQCSSEPTARYKSALLQGDTLTDLTGGFGIDTFFLSERFRLTHYVERQTELCDIARHNFALTDRSVEVHNMDSVDYLAAMPKVDCIYLDPARRSASGNKVFRLEDCEPDVTAIYTLLRQKCDTLLLKLSPMLDIAAALQALPHAAEVHVLSVKGEVKETLVLCRFPDTVPLRICAVNLLHDGQQTFSFLPDEEKNAVPTYAKELCTYLYEPNLSILKAGAFRTVAVQFGLWKLGVNTHLYTADRLLPDFPGRIFRLLPLPDKKALRRQAFHVITRNYPQTTDVLRRQLKIHEGGDNYLIGTRIADRPVLLMAERIS